MNRAEKEAAARKLRCPKCNAQPYQACKQYTRTKLKFLAHPHADRVALVDTRDTDLP